jgi:uncharacterized membrane protein YeaQ/YmgE (transglycosylase-associated protein family)
MIVARRLSEPRKIAICFRREGDLAMSIIGWLLLGVIAGFIASRIVGARGQGLLLDIVLGVVGAIVGGVLFSAFGAEGVTGFNLYSMSVATGRRSI